MEQPGLIIDGRYTLVKNLNTDGGMGTIWVADDMQNKRRVAVKFPLEHIRKDKEMLARFEREADIAVQVDGPNVVQIFARGKTSDDLPFIVMELLKGQDLGSFISTKAPCGLVQTQSIMAQLFRVTARLHSLNIVHRDIKAGNIYLTAEADETYSVKLLDFGIAKQRLNNGVKSLTRDFVSIGSVSYMAPEQMVNTRTVGAPADLYALGVVTYEMLTGRLPFELNNDGTLAEFYVKVAAGLFPSATSVNLNLPPAIDAWFTQALNPVPEQRFVSAEAMSAALAKIVSRVPPTTTFSGSVKIATAAPAYPVVADPPPQLRLSADTQVVKTRSSRSGWMSAAAAVVLLGIGGAYRQNQETEKQRIADEDIKHKAEVAAREEAKRAAARAAADEARSWAADAEAARLKAEGAAMRAHSAVAFRMALDVVGATKAAEDAEAASVRAETAAKAAGLAAMRAGADPEAAAKAEKARSDADAASTAAARSASSARKDAKDAQTQKNADDTKANAAQVKRDEKEAERVAAAAAAAAQAAREKAWYTPTEAQRTALIKAVKDTDAAETVAYRSLNGSKLSAFEEGARLSESYKTIATLKKNNTYSQSQLLGWDADLFSVNYDNDRAKVHVTESWNASFWDVDTNLCKFRLPKRAIPQWIYLRLTSAGHWKVTDVKHDNPAKQEPIACLGN